MKNADSRLGLARPLDRLEKNFKSMSASLASSHITMSSSPSSLVDHWRSLAEVVDKEAESSILQKIEQIGSQYPELRTGVQNLRSGLHYLRTTLLEAADGVESKSLNFDEARENVLAAQNGPFTPFSQLNKLGREMVREAQGLSPAASRAL